MSLAAAEALSRELPSDPITQVGRWACLRFPAYDPLTRTSRSDFARAHRPHHTLTGLLRLPRSKDHPTRSRISCASHEGSTTPPGHHRPHPPPRAPQALLALYFFLAGMLVKGHAYMWLLPCVSCACALGIRAVHAVSHALIGRYRWVPHSALRTPSPRLQGTVVPMHPVRCVQPLVRWLARTGAWRGLPALCPSLEPWAPWEEEDPPSFPAAHRPMPPPRRLHRPIRPRAGCAPRARPGGVRTRRAAHHHLSASPTPHCAAPILPPPPPLPQAAEPPEPGLVVRGRGAPCVLIPRVCRELRVPAQRARGAAAGAAAAHLARRGPAGGRLLRCGAWGAAKCAGVYSGLRGIWGVDKCAGVNSGQQPPTSHAAALLVAASSGAGLGVPQSVLGCIQGSGGFGVSKSVLG